MNNEELSREFEKYAKAKNLNKGNFELVQISDLDAITKLHLVYVNNQLVFPFQKIYGRAAKDLKHDF